MTDGKRKIVNDLAVINKGLIHHTAGDQYQGRDPEYVFNELNRIGFGRGFAPNGYDFKTGYSKQWGQNYHKHTDENGTVISYAEYHYAIYQFSPEVSETEKDSETVFKKITRPAEYRIVSLIDEPMMMDARSAGRQRLGESYADFIRRTNEWNSDAIAFCFCFNAEFDAIPESMIEFFINSFKKGQPLSWILYKNPAFKFFGHRDTGDQTVCPGKYLYSFIPRIQREVSLLS